MGHTPFFDSPCGTSFCYLILDCLFWCVGSRFYFFWSPDAHGPAAEVVRWSTSIRILNREVELLPGSRWSESYHGGLTFVGHRAARSP